MSNRKQREELANQTLAVIEVGGYAHPETGVWVEIGEATRSARAGTVLIDGDRLEKSAGTMQAAFSKVAITLANETTFAAGRRMASHGKQICCLNFASAKHPGGGFLGGSKAQEEDLACASALYPCLLEAPDYYEINRASGTELYTDHLIYSPAVPVFRDDEVCLLGEPWVTGIITCPAPKAGSVRKNEPEREHEIEPTLERRIKLVLEVARKFGERRLVLGAWGCGVFRNDPVVCARLFREALESTEFAGAFDEVHFAVLDRSEDLVTFRAFESEIGGGPGG